MTLSGTEDFTTLPRHATFVSSDETIAACIPITHLPPASQALRPTTYPRRRTTPLTARTDEAGRTGDRAGNSVADPDRDRAGFIPRYRRRRRPDRASGRTRSGRADTALRLPEHPSGAARPVGGAGSSAPLPVGPDDARARPLASGLHRRPVDAARPLRAVGGSSRPLACPS